MLNTFEMPKLSISKYLPFITSYGFLVASLYSFAFWGYFKINILEFVGLADLLKLALYPIVMSFVGIVTMVMVMELIRSYNQKLCLKE
jgi:hypothetical protein